MHSLLHFPLVILPLWLACFLLVCLMLWLERRAASDVDDELTEKRPQCRWLSRKCH